MHPYKSAPVEASWRKAVASPAYDEVDPVGSAPFKLGQQTKIATAGSCFAQHIARHLKQSGFSYFMTEPPHPLMSEAVAADFNYGTFSARYGNIYTTRQLVQLFDRAYGKFVPVDSIWRLPSGNYVDAFRPAVTPNGYETEADCINDRTYHLSQVRKLFEECEVFVFTLGLTECWSSKKDGAIYPVCPEVSGGEFSHDRYQFMNFTVEQAYTDLALFYRKLIGVNPNVKIILTVSPVPLAATASTNHVLSATTYSKAVLRIVAERFVSEFPMAFYFPSYEVITGSFNRGRYYADDLRSVTEEGVNHVMRLFFKHMTDHAATHIPAKQRGDTNEYRRKMEQVVATNCEEEALDAD